MHDNKTNSLDPIDPRFVNDKVPHAERDSSYIQKPVDKVDVLEDEDAESEYLCHSSRIPIVMSID